MTRPRSTKTAPGRWPDVMIGVLTLALLGGFGALLLEQNKPAPVAAVPPSNTDIPASPGTVPEPAVVQPPATPPATQATTQQPGTQQPNTPAAQTPPQTAASATSQPQGQPNQTATATPAQGTTPPATTTQTPGTTGTTTPANPAGSTLAQTQEIPPVPKAPEVPPIKPPVLPEPKTPAQTANSTASTNTPTTQAPATQTNTTPAQTATNPAATATPAVAARSGGAVATSANRTPLRSDYRISLGSFSTRRTVQTQTSGVSGLGYTVHSIDLGDQYVAQVGPFADEATARQALADIQRAYPGALLYRPKAKASAEASSSDSSETTSAASGNAESSATERPRAAAPSGPTYLQVGAFDRVESAQTLVNTLKDNGFAPTVNNPPDRKTTVMVGPYSGDALLRAESRLDNAGLDHFRVR